MSTKFARRALGAGIITAVLAGGGYAVALADSAPSPNVFQGCLSRALGVVYSVQLNPSTPPKCLSHDTQISWSQTGPKGTPGIQGPKGDTGATGAQGRRPATTGASRAAGSQGRYRRCRS